MKILSKILSLSLVLFFSNCSSSKKVATPNFEVHFSAQNRGYSEIIDFSKNNLHLKTTREEKTVVLSTKQLSSIQEALSEINLSEIASLKAPSEKRIYDGAMTAIIIIKKGNETFTSSGFDHDNPPKELTSLVSLLRTYLK
ncbi:hypothetical protein MC378_09565 [Polaribacter sp. MSW13]|uniref:Lipoprotein n=1 Tax=Polaribacter marinus TaxID=2916838 RepID=A0A9X1VNF6_9FLAO|nr:hypothetical protein [Polaribacter marinus]MCI2229412.1 hypothetical protein [Polaribacter marinus]